MELLDCGGGRGYRTLEWALTIVNYIASSSWCVVCPKKKSGGREQGAKQKRMKVKRFKKEIRGVILYRLYRHNIITHSKPSIKFRIL